MISHQIHNPNMVLDLAISRRVDVGRNTFRGQYSRASRAPSPDPGNQGFADQLQEALEDLRRKLRTVCYTNPTLRVYLKA